MRFLFGVITALLLVVLAVYFYFRFGYAPVATAAPPIPFEIKLAHLALHARIESEAPSKPPFQASEDDLADGARLYRQHCAVCHGVKDQDKTAIAVGMFPEPPQLLKGKGVTDDPAGETYWKVKNGIRLTGMPAFDKSLSEKQMWEISQLLAQADRLPPSTTADLSRPLQSP